MNPDLHFTTPISYLLNGWALSLVTWTIKLLHKPLLPVMQRRKNMWVPHQNQALCNSRERKRESVRVHVRINGSLSSHCDQWPGKCGTVNISCLVPRSDQTWEQQQHQMMGTLQCCWYLEHGPREHLAQQSLGWPGRLTVDQFDFYWEGAAGPEDTPCLPHLAAATRNTPWSCWCSIWVIWNKST